MELNKNQIFNQFKNQGIHVLSDWIGTQLGSFPNYSYQQIYDVFLNTDLSQSCNSVPAKFMHRWGPELRGNIHKENVFEQGVVFQITEILDVSKSISRQIDIATGVLVEEDFEKEMDENSAVSEIKNSKTKPKCDKKKPKYTSYTTDFFPGSRTLKLTLSDGANFFTGYEYKPIPFLTTETPLGCKVRIKGPLVLRGVMMLDSKNVQLLGGSISEINHKTYLERLEEKLKLLSSNPTSKIPAQNSLVNSTHSDKRTGTFNEPSQKRKATTLSKQAVNSNTTSIGSNQILPVSTPIQKETIISLNETIDLIDDSDILIDDEILMQADLLIRNDPKPINIDQELSIVELLSSSDSNDKDSMPSNSKGSNSALTKNILLSDEFSDYDLDDFMN